MKDTQLYKKLVLFISTKLRSTGNQAERIVTWLFTPNAVKPSLNELLIIKDGRYKSVPHLGLGDGELVISYFDYLKLTAVHIRHESEVYNLNNVNNLFVDLYVQYTKLSHEAKHSPQSQDTEKQPVSAVSTLNDNTNKIDSTQCYGVIYPKHGVERYTAVCNVQDKPKTYRTNKVVACGSWVVSNNPFIFHKDDYGYESLTLNTVKVFAKVRMNLELYETAEVIGTSSQFVLVLINNIYLVVKFADVTIEPTVETTEDFPELFIPKLNDYVEVEHPQYSAFGKVVAINDLWIAIESPSLVITTFEIEHCSITRSDSKKCKVREQLLQYRYNLDNIESYVDSIDEIYKGS